MTALLLQCLVLGLLFVLSGFFSSAETALFSLSKIEKRRLSDKHPALAVWVFDHLEHPRRTLLTILIGNLLVNTLGAALATLIILRSLGPRFLGVFMLMYTVVLILFFEILPKVLAARQNERVALFSAVPLKIFSIFFGPIGELTQKITDRILSFVRHERVEHSEHISEAELKAMVKIGEEEGVLDSQERYMLQKLFDLGERQVREIMTPRVDLAALDVEDSGDEHLAMMKKYHFSYFPVYQDSPDHILGVISVEEYLLSRTRVLRSLLKQPFYVPESKRIDNLLEEFRKKEQDFAICVDEYGGTAGIVTLEDILEEIFGEFYDEYARAENPIRPFGHDASLVEAKINTADFNEHFQCELEVEEATTLGGYILERLGTVPKKGTTLEINHWQLEVHHVVRQRIISVIVRRKK